MKKEIFEDKRISWAAKGIMSYLLSKPENWVLHIYDLQYKNSRGIKSLKTAVKELASHGYIELKSFKDEHSRFYDRGYVLGDWYYEFLLHSQNKTKIVNEEYYSIEWQKKRLGILERDEWKCRECGSDTGTLHVHHLKYNKGKPVWDIEDEYLITLCYKCHKKKHL